MAALAFASALLAGCGSKAATPPPPAVATGPDLSRPCELLTPALATSITGQPYFRAMVTNLVEDGTVSCAHALGGGGLQGLVRAVVHLPQAAGPAELRFAALCRGEITSRLLRQDGPLTPPQTQARAEESAGTTASGGNICALPSGGFAVLLSDRVMEVGYEEGNGTDDPVLSRRFAEALLRAAGPQP